MRLQRDDKRPKANPGAVAGADRERAAEYQQILRDYRRSQLEVGQASIRRIEQVFDGAVRELAAKVRNASSGSLAEANWQALLSDISARLAALRQDYAALLTVGMVESAQAAANREQATGLLVGAAQDAGLLADLSQSFLLSSGEKVAVEFGRLAARAVERAASRVYSDGWQLSDRLYRLDAATREVVQNTLVQGVAEQISAHKLAQRLKSSLSQAGADNPRYQAMRIARTEINTAHREAHIHATLEPGTGQLKEWILGIGWRLSMSHGDFDVCDIWAEDDGDDLGPGNYLPENVPGSHPHCLCYTITVLKEFPEVSVPAKDPQADEVPESQARYYAEKYDDPAARRWLQKRGLDDETSL